MIYNNYIFIFILINSFYFLKKILKIYIIYKKLKIKIKKSTIYQINNRIEFKKIKENIEQNKNY